MTDFLLTKKDIKHSISRSQHCQRNWDLEQQIPEDDLNLLIHAVTQCPSKQNEIYYKVTAVKNREMIESIHSSTNGFTMHDASSNTICEDGSVTDDVVTVTNSQTLANVLFVFSKDYPISNRSQEVATQNIYNSSHENIERQRLISLGIASGYLNLTASMLGYSTGCCSCFDYDKVHNVVPEPLLLMGVGFKNQKRSRLEHHLDASFRFPTFNKKIDYKILE